MGEEKRFKYTSSTQRKLGGVQESDDVTAQHIVVCCCWISVTNAKCKMRNETILAFLGGRGGGGGCESPIITAENS